MKKKYIMVLWKILIKHLDVHKTEPIESEKNVR